MKRILFVMALSLPLFMMGQVVEKQTQEGNFFRDTVSPIIPVDRQKLLKDVDLIFNSRFAYNSHFTDGNHDISNFSVDQFRLELKGKIHDKVYFRFRDRYTRGQEPGNLDNISRSTDLAFVRVDFAPRTSFSLGKLCTDWGGYEFDFNPIDILAYNDILEFADNFLAGAGISHTLKNNKHSFSLQLTNSRTKTYQEQYGASAPPNSKASEYPFAAIFNWRGSFFKGKFETTYSYSFFNEAVGKPMSYFVFGNKFKPNKNFVLYYDFQYRDEGLDRLGIVSGIIPDTYYAYAAENVRYMENWIRAEYFVAPKVNLLMVVMNSNHYWDGNPDKSASSKLSTSYGLIPQIQYLPFKDFNMKFYAAYVYRKYDYTKYAESAFGVKDYSTGVLSFGVIAPFLVL